MGNAQASKPSVWLLRPHQTSCGVDASEKVACSDYDFVQLTEVARAEVVGSRLRPWRNRVQILALPCSLTFPP